MNRPSGPLVGMLGLLRRPQNQADLDRDLVRVLDRQFSSPQVRGRWGTPVLPLARFATVTPLEEKVFIVPCGPPTSADREALDPRVRRLTSRHWEDGADRLGIFLVHRGRGGGAGLVSASAIEHGKAATWTGCSGGTAVVLVVPDGVKRVDLLSDPDDESGATTRVTATVQNNVLAVVIPGAAEMPVERMVWYDQSDEVVGRVGQEMGDGPSEP